MVVLGSNPKFSIFLSFLRIIPPPYNKKKPTLLGWFFFSTWDSVAKITKTCYNVYKDFTKIGAKKMQNTFQTPGVGGYTSMGITLTNEKTQELAKFIVHPEFAKTRDNFESAQKTLSTLLLLLGYDYDWVYKKMRPHFIRKTETLKKEYDKIVRASAAEEIVDHWLKEIETKHFVNLGLIIETGHLHEFTKNLIRIEMTESEATEKIALQTAEVLLNSLGYDPEWVKILFLPTFKISMQEAKTGKR